MAIALNTHQTTLLTEALGALNNERFGTALLAFIRDLANFDSAVMLAYPEDAKLVVLHDELDAGDRAGFDGSYRNGLYMLSPLYINARGGLRGCFHVSDIAPDGFTESEFYELYYSTNDSIDQVAYFMETANGTPLALSLERTSKLPPFTRKERNSLNALYPLVAQLIQQQRWPNQLEPASPAQDMHTHLQQVMEKFGSSTLTPREREVVRLILRGYPSKSVARELDISTQTEQVHRKNIYQKLGISSHSELFTLFFDAIALPQAAGDPLLALRA